MEWTLLYRGLWEKGEILFYRGDILYSGFREICKRSLREKSSCLHRGPVGEPRGRTSLLETLKAT
jgi:hypothetical protein